MPKNYLAFDLGASSGRAIIGRLAEGKLTLEEVHRFPNGAKEIDDALFWDFEQLWHEIKTGLVKALAVESEIHGIGIDTWGVDYVLLKGNGEFARLPYMYRDKRTEEAVPRVYKMVTPEEFYRRTGLQFMPFNTVFQLDAHRQQHPEDLSGSTLLMMPDAIKYRLCGKTVCEYTDASTTMLLDAKTRSWDMELIERLDLPSGIFPKLAAPCSLAGTLRPELQKELSCSDIPVWNVGGHDTASAVASVPADISRPWAYVSCGTWALLGAELDEPKLTETARIANYTNEGGLNDTIRFLSNITGSWLFQECRRIWSKNGIEISFAEMEKMAKDAAPFAFIINPNAPDFAAPADMPESIRDFCLRSGQKGDLNDKALLRCIYDSLSLCFKAKIAELENLLDTRYEFLHMVGGGTKDSFLMQLTADALGIPVIAGPVEATAIGNLLAQAIADGELADLAAGRELVRQSFELKTYQAAGDQEQISKVAEKFSQLL